MAAESNLSSGTPWMPWTPWPQSIPKSLFLAFSLIFVLHANSAPLRNLGFEDYDPTTRILEDWHLSTPLQPNRFSETNIWLGVPPGFVDGPLAHMVDVSLFSNLGLDGKYALEFVAPGPWTLSQKGSFPQDAKFLSWVNIGPVQMTLKLDGVSIPVDYYYDSVLPFIRSSSQADISAYAGKNVDLDLTFGIVPPQFAAPGQPYYSIIDNIGFAPIPEPSTVALLGVCSLVLLWRRIKIRR